MYNVIIKFFQQECFLIQGFPKKLFYTFKILHLQHICLNFLHLFGKKF